MWMLSFLSEPCCVNVGCPVRRVLRPFVSTYVLWCDRCCVWHLCRLDRSDFRSHYEIVKPWRYNFVCAFIMRVFGPSCRFLRILRSECTISSHPIARLCVFAHVFAHFGDLCSSFRSFSLWAEFLYIPLRLRLFTIFYSDFCDFLRRYLLWTRSYLPIVDPWHIK